MNPAPSQDDLKTSSKQTEPSTTDHEAPANTSSPDIDLTLGHEPEEARPLNPSDPTSIERFYRTCLNQARIQLFVSSAVILLIVQLKVNFFLILIVLWIASFQLSHTLKSHKEDFAYVFEREKSKALLTDPSNPNPGEESVEWINSALASLWPLISPDIFRPVIDLLEDTLKVLAPGIVTTVRVDELDQGRNSIRLVAFKTLDAEDPWVKNQIKVSDLPGEFINLEVEFTYRRKHDSAEPASSAHFVAYFGIGVQKIASCEMPVFVQIDGLHGKIKLRVQLIAVPPFVQMTTFSFSHLPQVEITAKPMHGFNVMSLPVISHFIRASVDVLLGQFCLPSSYTLDLSRILLGNDALMRPRHVGVIAIALHSASNLKVSDILNHTSDPYVSISFMKSASKPLFSTLIHFRTLDPIFEEMAFVLITPDQLLEKERLCLTVCHSDRISSDNVLGKVEVDLQTAVQSRGSMTTHNSELTARLPGYTVQGSLSWSVGYFGFHEDSIPKDLPTVTSDPGLLLNAMDAESSADDSELNSGVEHFVEDFDRTRVDLVVMEVRAREHDSIVGIVSVPLNKFLSQQHQLTKWWTLTGGNGSGKMRASVLFQPVDIKLERPLCGWSIGVIEIFKISIVGPLLEAENFYVKMTIDSQSNQCSKPTDEASVTRQGQSAEVQWVFKPRMKLPVTGNLFVAFRNRMQTTLTLQLMKPSTGKLALRDHAVSKPIHVWLSDVLHDDMVCLDVEISKTSDTITEKLISLPRVHSDQQTRRKVELPQAFSTLSNDSDSVLGSMSKQTHSTEVDGDRRSVKSSLLPSIPQQLQEHENDTQRNLDEISMTGSQSSRMHIAFRFVPGISKAHRALGSSDPGLMEVYQTCQRTISSGDRMRHPIIVDTYDVEQTNDGPVTPEAPQLSDDSIITDTNSSNSGSPQIGPETPSNPNNGKDTPSTHDLANDLLRDHRLKILDVDEAAENWTDDETSSGDDLDEETSTHTSGISPKLLRLKRKTLELKESLLPKTLANKFSPPRDPTSTDVILRRRKELKGESKEVYGLGPSRIKAVRTVKWARDSAKVGLQKMKDQASHRTPKHGLQKEAISSF
ncbi:uncharacterized protein MELLADRAFT_77186 [Melampsora larici-populina 98AG31]|uniref:C2 domain-containing protein n=1 Tax=Melampsora larici-populina (strain 98AG31 / pathotype 3-4-7) TaxID=747676 RepID=F4REF7_MELLP|nr:uncharacterized protein MELLADRAFT_77186 [Melampsora larici-populina 98AG31]EGG09082.1 hypothetical protein MELLADRAFT_77186 [Melampsora larici-populina 98AG31]